MGMTSLTKSHAMSAPPSKTEIMLNKSNCSNLTHIETESSDDNEKKIEYSLTVTELNNRLINMRKLTRKATDFFVQKRIKRIKVLKKSEELNKKRIERNERYISVANKLNVDALIKFLIWNEQDENTIMDDDKSPIEQKVAFQIGKSSKDIEIAINNFRLYQDWREMANTLLAKNTSRNFKHVRSDKSQAEWLPIPENCHQNQMNVNEAPEGEVKISRGKLAEKRKTLTQKFDSDDKDFFVGPANETHKTIKDSKTNRNDCKNEISLPKKSSKFGEQKRMQISEPLGKHEKLDLDDDDFFVSPSNETQKTFEDSTTNRNDSRNKINLTKKSSSLKSTEIHPSMEAKLEEQKRMQISKPLGKHKKFE